jgi:hypothetical protein
MPSRRFAFFMVTLQMVAPCITQQNGGLIAQAATSFTVEANSR